MKLSIFNLLNKIDSPILVLNNEQIIYLNNYFLEAYLQEYYFDSTAIAKLTESWEIQKFNDQFNIVNKYSKIKHKSSFITEFIDNENGIIQYYKVYKFQDNYHSKYSIQ